MCDINWTAIGSIATGAAAIGTFIMIREIKNQSAASVKPDLVLLTTDMYVNVVQANHNFQRSGWDAVNNRDGQLEREPFCFRFVNIGLGSAKNIAIHWLFSIEDVLSNAKSHNLLMNYTIQDGGKSVIFIGTNKRSSNVSNYMAQQYDSCLTVGNQPNGIKFLIPEFIKDLIDSASVEFLKVDAKERTALQVQIPNLFGANKISVTYEDLHGNSFKKEYKLQLELLTIGSGAFDGKFSISQI